ncbi:hypothetical protein [Hoeflea sp.]|uniref:hypothetical protein n=1 Tax=Hoeflea sp. TaxID=1940281 RepID=UPI0025C664D7|nr:hypothetical protein [Hoeflea sp.]
MTSLSALINATTQNLSQFKAFSAIYQLLQEGVPNIAGYTALINSNNDTNFGSKTSTSPGPVFNSENIFINVANALFQGNATAKTAFDGIANGTTLAEKLVSVYQSLVVPSQRTTEGQQAFAAQADFYAARAVELGIPGDTGGAVVAFGSLLDILVRENNEGIGNSVSDLLMAVNDGTALLPETSTTTIDIEIADGARYDADDGFTNTITSDSTVQALVGTPENDKFVVTPASLNAGDSFSGGKGTDIVDLQFSGGSALVPTGLTFQDIEQFVFSGTYSGGTIDASKLTGAQAISQTGSSNSPANVSNLESGTIVSFTDSKLKDTPVSVGYKAGATEANLQVTNVQDLSEITVLGGDLTTLNVSGSVAKNSSGGAGSFDLFMISQDLVSPSKLTTLNVNFESDVNIIPHAVGALSVTTIDSSGSSGQINMAAIALAGDGVTPLQDVLSVSSIKGGSGGSSIALALENYKASTLTLDAGSGNTSLRIVDGIDASATALQVVIKGGGGSNTLVFGDGPGPGADGLGNVKSIDEAGIRSGIISFENFDVTKDVINVSTLGTLDALTTSEMAAVSAAANLSAATALAVTNSANSFTVFDFGGNTYVVSDTNTDGAFSSGDGLIEIVGVSSADLSAVALVTA